VQRWSRSTRSRYNSYYRNHLSPQWGERAIASITALEVDGLKKKLLDEKHLKPGTVYPIMELLGRMLGDAAFDKRISHSPVRPRDRRGERGADQHDEHEGIAITLEQLLAICARLPHREALLVLVTAFTGMRWGEAAGMRRSLLFLQPAEDGTPAFGWYSIDKKIGALKEEDGTLSLGGPKTKEGVRTIELPPFLVELLLKHLKRLPAHQDMLFPSSTGEGYRRSNFARQLWRPACDGWPAREARRGHPGIEEAPTIVKGMRFHDLRHTHDTWLTEEHVPKIARDARLGHKTPGIEGIYTHVTDVMKRPVEPRGLEPLTPALQRQCSAN
jgi:integrase